MRSRTSFTFLATTLTGLVLWALSRPMVAGALFGSQAYEVFFSGPFLVFFGPLPLAVLVAAIAGYVSPRRFWLWGLAVVLLRPVLDVLLYFNPARQAGVIGLSEYIGLAVIEVMIFMSLVALCTAGSGAGAGLRLLVRRTSQRSSGAAP